MYYPFVPLTTGTTARRKLTKVRLLEAPIALAPVAEQAEIVALVSEKLSQIEAAEKAINRSLRRATRLRQSILKQAFEGKLVPQDPTDEPARTLLKHNLTSKADSNVQDAGDSHVKASGIDANTQQKKATKVKK
jgi:hypothetical protein